MKVYQEGHEPRPTNQWVCDFCDSPDVIGGYEIKDFEMPEYLWGSEGCFAVCAVCKDLIERGQWPELLERSANNYQNKVGMPDDPNGRLYMRTAIEKLHQQFRNLRTAYKPIGAWKT